MTAEQDVAEAAEWLTTAAAVIDRARVAATPGEPDDPEAFAEFARAVRAHPVEMFVALIDTVADAVRVTPGYPVTGPDGPTLVAVAVDPQRMSHLTPHLTASTWQIIMAVALTRRPVGPRIREHVAAMTAIGRYLGYVVALDCLVVARGGGVTFYDPHKGPDDDA